MTKKLRHEPLYVAPGIVGWIDSHENPIVYDEIRNEHLNPDDVFDKIKIYERQVEEWFINRATDLLEKENYSLIVLMVCLSYLEGVEQYRRGESSRGRSQEFFVGAFKRLYPNKYSDNDLEDFYRQARCGLFHNGMIESRIIFSNSRFRLALKFSPNSDIEVNPKLLLRDVKKDFRKYIGELKKNQALRDVFHSRFSIR